MVVLSQAKIQVKKVRNKGDNKLWQCGTRHHIHILKSLLVHYYVHSTEYLLYI